MCVFNFASGCTSYFLPLNFQAALFLVHQTACSSKSSFMSFLPLLYLEPCAIMPPLELFMEVSYDERRAMLYRDLERGDVVVGRINNIREYGFFLTLLCTAMGLKRDIEDLELSVG